jgi:hypothetical protein
MMNRLVDIRAEREVLEQLEDKGRLLRIELVACFIRFLKVPLIVLGYFIFSLLNLIIDVYLVRKKLNTTPYPCD